MTEHWNFRGYIAVPLEAYAQKYIGQNGASADEIAAGAFVDTMLQILTIVFGNLDNIGQLLLDCNTYADCPACQIPAEDSKRMFDEFKRLMNIAKK